VALGTIDGMKDAVTQADLLAYLDEALSEAELARVEQALRQSASLQQILRRLIVERDHGEHSLGALWRRSRLTCPSREQLGSFLLGVLEDEVADYVKFHLELVHCPYCQANLTDLTRRRKEPALAGDQRRHKLFTSSVGLVKKPNR
jgi:hypothetical protein